MALWLAMLSGAAQLPAAFTPVDWHAHEMLFGYLPAAMAGFLLTAVPNWTGRLPILGWPLAALVALWCAGRAAMLFGALLPQGFAAAIDLPFLIALALAIALEIAAGKNWRNLKILILIGALAAANGLFHWEAAQGGYAAGGVGARLAAAVAVMLIVVIGGRIVPSFTRNWLAKNSINGAEPASLGHLEAATMGVSFAALALWAALPESGVSAAACALAGLANALRLARWQGWRTGREALVWVLHAGYAFIPLGFGLLTAAWAWPTVLPMRAAQHAFMAGAIGVMTLAVMTRASLGHTGRALHADARIAIVYVCAIAAALTRIAAGAAGTPASLTHAAGALWIAAFAGFALIYAPILIAPRKT